MATPKKTAQGTWRVMVEVKGVRDSKTLPTKREATEWAQARVLELRHQATAPAGELHTLRDVLRRYADEVSPTKRGCRSEQIRLSAFERHPLPMDEPISKLTTSHLAVWRDARLKVNEAGTVLRDISLLSSVLETARREWQWIKANPMADLRKPAQPMHRERVIQSREIRGMLRALGHDGKAVRSVSQAVACCFLTALATGMRAGELCGLKWADVYDTHCHLPMTKNGSYRDVPLSPVARRLIERMKGWDGVSVFGLKPQTLDAMFRKYREKAGLDGFTFHDARRTAATRISRQVDVLMLCRIFGWSNPSMAMVYYAPSAEQMASALDGRKSVAN